MSVIEVVSVLILQYKSYGAGVFRSRPNPYSRIPVNTRAQMCGLKIESNLPSVMLSQACRAVSGSGSRSTGPSLSHSPLGTFTEV